jgi:hypothetical protein
MLAGRLSGTHRSPRLHGSPLQAAALAAAPSRLAPRLRRRPGLPCRPPAAAAAALTLEDADPGAAREPDALAAPYQPPVPLPPTPHAATLSAIWPYLARLALGEAHLYWRVAGALIMLVASKAAGLMAPLQFKVAVDALGGGGAPGAAVPAAVAALVAAGAYRAGAALSKELQHPLFTPVSQAAGRRVSFYALAHVLSLDLFFHLDSNTGTPGQGQSIVLKMKPRAPAPTMPPENLPSTPPPSPPPPPPPTRPTPAPQARWRACWSAAPAPSP